MSPQEQSIRAEEARLADDAARRANWKRWGPYLSLRQWGTVREDYSADGSCWTYFPHDHARSRAYRWGEDGLLGFCDRQCRLCFAPALWNEKDPILKERLFGLGGHEGNHGEDVKELYYFLDNTPTHSYMKALYKYPHAEFPYAALVAENARRTRDEPEYELTDTGVFDRGAYWDVFIEYAKAAPDDILIRLTIENRGPAAVLHVLPTVWFRNTWAWDRAANAGERQPAIRMAGPCQLDLDHPDLGPMRLDLIDPPTPHRFLFTANETNTQRLWATPNLSPHVKDAFHELVVRGAATAVNAEGIGTKAAAHLVLPTPAGSTTTIRLRLRADCDQSPGDTRAFDAIFAQRRDEADDFYAARTPPPASDPEGHRIARQASAGLLWSKQFYHFVVEDWLRGDPDQTPPPEPRWQGRNTDWRHLFNRDVILMPDSWEYPWYAAWDLAFHCVAVARLDPDLAKDQLMLFLREWYMHPSGQIPAYEFALGDVNPPVHAWAVWRVYKMTAAQGHPDRLFLARCFQKLVMNFTWWVNRKDPEGRHIFAGGFLGLDNIGVFDRSRPLPTGGHLAQADGTAWMAFYCGTMLAMALELAQEDPAYEDMASKFFEHFVAIADAMNALGGAGLWDEHDGFYYDHLRLEGTTHPLRVRSLVGLIPLLAAEVIEESTIAVLPGFRKRAAWFLEHRKDLNRQIAYMQRQESGAAISSDESGRFLLAIPSRERLVRTLRFLVDENEFLSPFGLRSLSRVHQEQPYIFKHDSQEFRVEYAPGESTTPIFGGNSNWRGPVWFPISYLLIETIERYARFYGDGLTITPPNGPPLTLKQIADTIRQRLIGLFRSGKSGRRPCHGPCDLYTRDPASRDLILFHEYFHAETGQGLGASHQTGWTALVANLIGAAR